MSGPRGPRTCLFLPVTWLISLALLSPSGRPLAPARERAAGLRLAREAWGSSGACGLPGTVPSAERAVCPSGEEGHTEAAFAPSCCRAGFRAQPPPAPVLRGFCPGAQGPQAFGGPAGPSPGTSRARCPSRLLLSTSAFCLAARASPVRRQRLILSLPLATRGTTLPKFFLWKAGNGEHGPRAGARTCVSALRLPKASSPFAPFILTWMGVGAWGRERRWRHPQFVDGEAAARLIPAGGPSGAPQAPSPLLGRAVNKQFLPQAQAHAPPASGDLRGCEPRVRGVWHAERHGDAPCLLPAGPVRRERGPGCPPPSPGLALPTHQSPLDCPAAGGVSAFSRVTDRFHHFAS